MKNMSTVILTAFSTSSSNATLPLTMETVETKNGVSNKIASFTLPLGATINMNGTALYECVAVMFIAQAYGIDLSFGQQMVVIFTALLAAIGSAGHTNGRTCDDGCCPECSGTAAGGYRTDPCR
jgi:proton glutamate symport protein